MPSNIYIFFTSFLTVALGELDFAVHVQGDIIFIKLFSCSPSHLLSGGTEAAEKLAEKHQMVNMGEIIAETGYFLLRTKVGQLLPFCPQLTLG